LTYTGQAVERAALERDYLPAAFLPVRLAAAALEQMAAQLLQPARLDGRHVRAKRRVVSTSSAATIHLPGFLVHDPDAPRT
jgi:hypothetical protein